MRILRQSTSVDLPIGPFLDATDGATAETGLTITQPDIRLKKNGAAWAQKNAAQTLSHEENGNYEVTLDTTDTDTLGHLRLHVAESGALPIWEDFEVITQAAWDALFAGTGTGIRADVQVIANNAITAAAAAADFGAEIADAVCDEALSGHTTAGTLGQRLQQIDSGTAQAGAAGAITLRAGASAVDDFYTSTIVHITSGTGASQDRAITDYVGATKVATVSPNWATAPDNTSVYQVVQGVASEVSGTVNANVTSISGDSGAADSLESALDGTGGVALGVILGANAIPATAIASDAITAAKIAADAITATKIADNAITAAKLASGAITAAKFAAGAIDAAALSADAVDEILDEAIGDGTVTMRQALRVIAAAVAGKVSGAGTATITFRNLADSANVIVATVDDDGNRSAVTVTP